MKITKILVISATLLFTPALLHPFNQQLTALGQANKMYMLAQMKPEYKFMVWVDRSTLTLDQKHAFLKFTKHPNLPPTSVGKQCTYYGKPEVWCLILSREQAVKAKELATQLGVAELIQITEVKRIRGPRDGRS